MKGFYILLALILSVQLYAQTESIRGYVIRGYVVDEQRRPMANFNSRYLWLLRAGAQPD